MSVSLSQFGGKLITFGLTKAPGQQMQQTYPHQVFISQVTTETEFLLRSRELQMALQSGNLLDYCKGKIQTAKLQFDENLWNFLKVGWQWWSTEVISFALLGWNVLVMLLSSLLYFCSLRYKIKLNWLVNYWSKGNLDSFFYRHSQAACLPLWKYWDLFHSITFEWRIWSFEWGASCCLGGDKSLCHKGDSNNVFSIIGWDTSKCHSTEFL